MFPRLFAGISLSPAAREAGTLAIQSLERAAFDARYETPEKLHATLAFLGNVKPEKVEAVVEAFEKAAAEMATFEFTLDKLAAFPNERAPRIIYLGSRASNPAFRDLCERLRAQYRGLGFEFNDDAVLHVTIARKKGPSLRPLPMIDIQPVTMHVREIALFESITEERRTRYQILHTAVLRPEPVEGSG